MNKDKPKILIVDDTPSNIKVLGSSLGDKYSIFVATSGEKALTILKTTPIDIILLDIMMPEMDGYEVCNKIKDNSLTRNIPIIFITALTGEDDEAKGLELGAVDYIIKPIQPSIVNARVKTHLELKKHRDNLEYLVQERTKQVQDTQLEIIFRLAMASEYRDNETGLHITRISHLSAILAEAYGLDKTDCDEIFHASSMHDVGKIGIPDNILLKPGKLDANEFNIMKSHTTIGSDMLSGINCGLLTRAKLIAITHHEKWDGTGYPNGISGDDIPLEGRITALCDVFDALTSTRPYKKAWTVEETVAEIERCSDKHFDPNLVKLLKKVLSKFVAVKKKFGDKE
ncbi:MAG: two-component system response regulator [Desulfobacterales bacterium]|nr:two-component system response regulator [Desulfobacterales bacterium]